MASPDTTTDLGELVRRAAAGEQPAWDGIVDRFTPLLWSIGRAHRLDRESAADVVQMTWLRLLENLPRIHTPEALPGWLATTARHECLAVLRRTGRELPGWDVDLDRQETVSDDIDALLLADERNTTLWRCFNELSERCRRLLRVVVTVEKVSYSEVSEALGLPVGSIGPTRMRCLDRLRASLVRSAYPFDAAAGGAR